MITSYMTDKAMSVFHLIVSKFRFLNYPKCSSYRFFDVSNAWVITKLMLMVLKFPSLSTFSVIYSKMKDFEQIVINWTFLFQWSSVYPGLLREITVGPVSNQTMFFLKLWRTLSLKLMKNNRGCLAYIAFSTPLITSDVTLNGIQLQKILIIQLSSSAISSNITIESKPSTPMIASVIS